MITVPRGKLQQNYNLVYDALETSRLEESVNKLNENDGIMVVRIKTIKQFDNVVQDLREIEGAVGKTLHIYDKPDNLPKFKDQIISLEYVNDCKGVKVEGATYNMKRFLTMQVINFSWRNPVGSVHHEISAFCFYIFTYMNKTYSNKLSMIDDDEDMPPLLSAMDFDDEA